MPAQRASRSPSPAQRAGTRALTHVVRRPTGPTIHPVPAKFIHVQSEPDPGHLSPETRPQPGIGADIVAAPRVPAGGAWAAKRAPLRPRSPCRLPRRQANGQFTYVPNPRFLGTDQFSYVAADATSTSAPATVTLTVTNTAPVAQADSFVITRDVFDSVSQGAPRLLSNDTDRDGDALTASLVIAPSRGDLVINPDGTWRYAPDKNWFGTVTATYRVSDGLTQSAPATITFQVVSPFSPPTNLADVPLTGLE